MIKRILVVAASLLLPAMAQAELSVFACEPEWESLAKEIGGALVTASSATTAMQDPHYIQAKPSFIAKVRRADLVICSGAQLEIGWLPVLLQKANNPRVAVGTPGFFEAGSFVVRLEATTSVDRSQGDIHPQGNPHVQTNPHNVTVIAAALAERMAKLDAANESIYKDNLQNFDTKWRAAIVAWEQKAKPLQNKRAITHHKSWVYLEQWLGISEVANLEPVPGLPPTANHLSRLVSEFNNGGADFIIRSPYQDAKPSEWLAERTGIPAVMLPLTVGGTVAATDLFSMFDDIIDRLLGALPQ
jgi:zinc/manganese transport system substrate-binding protein